MGCYEIHEFSFVYILRHIAILEGQGYPICNCFRTFFGLAHGAMTADGKYYQKLHGEHAVDRSTANKSPLSFITTTTIQETTRAVLIV